MSEPDEAAIARLLGEHRFVVDGCVCGWKIDRNAPMLPTYEAHVAAVLAAHMADREADAWDAGLEVGRLNHRACNHLGCPDSRCYIGQARLVPPNPFRLTPDTEGDD